MKRFPTATSLVEEPVPALPRPALPPRPRKKDLRTEPGLEGTLTLLPSFASRFVPARPVLVYTPPGYAASRRRYPVLYLQDGQNLFDPRTAYVPGNDWRLGETIDALILRCAIEPLIVVGVYHTGTRRIDEYTPTRDPKRKAGGNAELYARFLIEELKPLVDAAYRTRTGPRDTGIGGSSMGGLVSLFCGLEHSQVFGKLALLSPSLWWDGELMTREVRALAEKPRLRIWLDIGGREPATALGTVRRLRDALRARGFTPGRDLAYREIRAAGHDERSWGRRAGDVLRFLFPPAPAPHALQAIAEPRRPPAFP